MTSMTLENAFIYKIKPTFDSSQGVNEFNFLKKFCEIVMYTDSL